MSFVPRDYFRFARQHVAVSGAEFFSRDLVLLFFDIVRAGLVSNSRSGAKTAKNFVNAKLFEQNYFAEQRTLV